MSKNVRSVLAALPTMNAAAPIDANENKLNAEILPIHSQFKYDYNLLQPHPYEIHYTIVIECAMME